MILTCPDCATKYSTVADAIGPNGRTVRCSNCNSTWFVSAEPDVFNLQDQEKAEQVIVETPREERYVESDDIGAHSGGHEFSSDEPGESVGAHVHIRDMADQRKRNKRLMGISMVWFVTLGALVIGAILAFQNRQHIVEKYPASASIYQAMGMNVNAYGLEFEDPVIRRLPVDGVPTLVINGHIVNISDGRRDIPMLELSIVNKSKEVLASWAIEPPQPTLDAGGRIEYSSEYPNPPIEGETVEYRFLDEGEFVAPDDPSDEEQEDLESLE